MRLREEMQLKTIRFEDILGEEVRLETSLQESLIEVGQKDVIKVTPRIVEDKLMYVIVNGRRRAEALRRAGKQTIKALVVNDIDDTELHLQALIGNSGTPNEIDEYDHICFLLSKGLNQAEIAKQASISPSTVTQRLRLGKLINEFKQALRRGEITYSAALNLTYLQEEEQRKIFLSGDKITIKTTKERKDKRQSQNFLIDFDEEEQGEQGLYITSEEMQQLLGGLIIEKSYNGSSVMLRVQ